MFTSRLATPLSREVASKLSETGGNMFTSRLATLLAREAASKLSETGGNMFLMYVPSGFFRKERDNKEYNFVCFLN